MSDRLEFNVDGLPCRSRCWFDGDFMTENVRRLCACCGSCRVPADKRLGVSFFPMSIDPFEWSCATWRPRSLCVIYNRVGECRVDGYLCFL